MPKKISVLCLKSHSTVQDKCARRIKQLQKELQLCRAKASLAWTGYSLLIFSVCAFHLHFLCHLPKCVLKRQDVQRDPVCRESILLFKDGVLFQRSFHILSLSSNTFSLLIFNALGLQPAFQGTAESFQPSPNHLKFSL